MVFTENKIKNIALSNNYLNVISDILKKENDISYIFLPNNRSCRALREKLKKSNLIIPEIIAISDILGIPNMILEIVNFLSCYSDKIPFNNLYELAVGLDELMKELILNNIKEEALINSDNFLANKNYSLSILQGIYHQKFFIDIKKMFHVKLNSWLELIKNKKILTAGLGEANYYTSIFVRQAYLNGFALFSGSECKESYNYYRNLKVFKNYLKVTNCDEIAFLDGINNVQNCINSNDFRRLLEFDNIETEALGISLIIREALSNKKNVIIVCPNEDLSINIQSNLQRWNIYTNVSLGKAFFRTFLGQFIFCISSMIETQFKNQEVINFLKLNNKLYNEALQLEEVLRKHTKYPQNFFQTFDFFYEKNVFIEEKDNKNLESPERVVLSSEFFDFISFLRSLFEQLPKTNTLNGWLNYIDLFFKLIDDDKSKEKFSALIVKFDKNLSSQLTAKEFIVFLRRYILSQPVNDTENYSSGVTILGALEAQLLSSDLVIICDANEQSWSPSVKIDFWLSKPLLKKIGLKTSDDMIEFYSSILERLAYQPNVIITRSKTISGESVLIHPIFREMSPCYEHDVYKLIEVLSKRTEKFKHNLSEGNPPLSVRPITLWVSDFDLMISNPYAFYAKKILCLKELHRINEYKNVYGNLLHDVLDKFFKVSETRKDFERLKLTFEEIKKQQWISIEQLGLWNFSTESLLRYIISNIDDTSDYFTEIFGQCPIKVCNGDVSVDIIIASRADRLDLSREGYVSIVDYKTGEAPSKNKVTSGIKIQLPIEAIIAKQNGFKIQHTNIEKMSFWQLKERNFKIIDITNSQEESDELCSNVLIQISDIIRRYNINGEPYLANCDEPYNKAYNHLARVKEYLYDRRD